MNAVDYVVFHRPSHSQMMQDQHTGKEKVTYNTIESAKKAAEAMSKKREVHFSFYKCLFCDGYHIGKNRDNKIEGYDN